MPADQATRRRSASSSRLAAGEGRVLAALAAREHELVELARELVATPSPNPPGDERAVAEVVRQAMAQLGYRVRVVGRADERPNVVGEIGVGARSLILNGHLDTKPPGDEAEWRLAPYDPVVEDGRLHGLGSTDMKGAVAAMVFAGHALAEAGELPGVLRVVLTADEEAGSAFGARFVAGAHVTADAALVGEPTGLTAPWQFIAVASRGISCFRLRVRGTQMHSSLSDRLPSVNASVELARVLARFADDFEQPDEATVNLGVTLSGGVFFGVYPGEAECGVDVRTVPGMSLEGLKADVEAFLDLLRGENSRLDIAADWVPELAWLPPSEIDGGHPLVSAAETACRDVLGRSVPREAMPAFTDGAIWSEAGIPSVPALGPGLLPFAHRPNEYVAVSEIVEAARIYALTARRYLAAPERDAVGASPSSASNG
jgi:acetylornithine deacetylase/succinyl-diaminopimelate desuccinylase-like protein